MRNIQETKLTTRRRNSHQCSTTSDDTCDGFEKQFTENVSEEAFKDKRKLKLLPDKKEDIFLDSWAFVIFRAVLLITIFILLHWCYNNYIFTPLFRPETSIDFDFIISKLCPQGAESCDFTLRENWKILLQDRMNTLHSH